MVDQRLEFLSDPHVQLADALIEFAFPAILSFEREVEVFLRMVEGLDQLGGYRSSKLRASVLYETVEQGNRFNVGWTLDSADVLVAIGT